jgi:uncharacterized protein YqjF (DUF2071 family)
LKPVEPLAGTMSGPLAVTARDVLFAHWPVDPAAVERAVPDGLSVATRDGSAWLTVVVLEMTGVELGPVRPPTRPFAQINLRTYVERSPARGGGDLGVYFLSLDAGDAAAARAGAGVWSLPFHAADSEVRRRGEEVVVRSRRRHDGARFDARYRPDGDPSPAAPGSLADFLIERHRYYVETGDGLAVGEIERDPWRLAAAAAEIRTNTLPAAAGLPAPEAPPRFHYSPRFESTTGRPAPVE